MSPVLLICDIESSILAEKKGKFISLTGPKPIGLLGVDAPTYYRKYATYGS
jgi:hypothetical protein